MLEANCISPERRLLHSVLLTQTGRAGQCRSRKAGTSVNKELNQLGVLLFVWIAEQAEVVRLATRLRPDRQGLHTAL